MEGWIDGLLVGWLFGLMGEWKASYFMYRRLIGWYDGRLVDWMDGIDIWIDRWMDGKID